MTEAHPLRCETCKKFHRKIKGLERFNSNIGWCWDGNPEHEKELIFAEDRHFTEKKGCASHSAAKKSEAVLEELIKWLYEEGMKFEKICDSEENFVNATGACARRAQCYYTIEKLKELRQQEREQG